LAELAGRPARTIRLWCTRDKLGVRTERGFRIHRGQARDYLVERFGAERLPVALR
jgi:hypothetical protein